MLGFRVRLGLVYIYRYINDLPAHVPPPSIYIEGERHG